ncbi:MAG: carboxylating nicotinate-nucleotide diphosphorylase [Syntrophomonas sp.]
MEFLGLDDLIKIALAEDIGHGDITTDNLVDGDQETTGIFLAKSPGILAGLKICQAVFKYLDPNIEFISYKQDGFLVAPGENIAEVKGKTQILLTGERVSLNFLQRLSGIATRTRQMADMIEGSGAQIVDTRKTTPGLRNLEKYAVSMGGGRNHRFGLYDGVMIKDNHIKAAGGISQAISRIRPRVPHTVKIEVEVETLEQLQEALQVRADIIMLDNMDVETMKKAVAMVNGQALLEASGGINEATLVEVARTGVDFISIGALTHSVTSLDISFNII